MASFDVARVRRFTVIGVMLLGLSTAYSQRLSSADTTDMETTRLVSRMIPKFHFARKEIDDQTSSLLLDTFIKDLDARKLYFLKSDIDVFEGYRTVLDDAIKAGDVKFCYDVYRVYTSRAVRQLDHVLKLIQVDQDFTIDETMEGDPKKLEWAKDYAELNERWRKLIKYEILQGVLDGKSVAETRERLEKRYRSAKLTIEQITPAEQLETYLTALTRCYDPHSSYMSPQSWEDFDIQMRLSLDGIGAALRSEDGYTVVAEVVPGGAAAEEGTMKPGDKIIGVGQDAAGEVVEIYRMKLNDVVRKIRGPRGTIVRLQIQAAGGGETKTISLTRKKIELKESEVKGEIIDTQSRIGRPGRIGVISLPSYYHDFSDRSGGGEAKSAAVDMARILDNFEKEGVDAVIIDQRMNGGGALTEAVAISGMFIDRGPVVQVKEPSGYVTSLSDDVPGVRTSKPVVVLNNRFSASASEIFAGMIKDYRRGIVIGDSTTHGKGTVQSLMDVSPRQPFSLIRQGDRGKLKLTIQQFYRVNGHSTQNLGVPSDIVLPSLFDHMDVGESSMELAMPYNEVPAVRHSSGNLASPEIISQLQKKSENRVTNVEEFQKLNANIRRYLERKDKTQISLNEETARKERENDQAAKKEAEAIEGVDGEGRKSKADQPIFPKRYYEDEVLNITLDYIDSLRSSVAAS